MTDIFVFGSNLEGRHGKGAAKAALSMGAVYGKGIGPWGSTYAIPTKSTPYISLPLKDIKTYVDDFISYALRRPELTFYVTRIGCGLAGYTDTDIAPMFKDVPKNCILPKEWIKWQS